MFERGKHQNLEIDQDIQPTKHEHFCKTENKNIQSKLKKGISG